MSLVLFVVGILLAIAGFLTLGFGIPNKEFSFGSTLILTGTVSLCAGFLLIGVSFVVRELRRIARLLEGQGATAGPAKAHVRPAELPEARVPPAARAAPAPETFPHDYAPRDAAVSAPPAPPHAAPIYAPAAHERGMPHDLAHDLAHDTAQDGPHDAPPWASEMRRPSAASSAAMPGAPAHGAPQVGSKATARDAAHGHHHQLHAATLQTAPEPFEPEPFELTPPPEPASPPRPSLASRFGFPSRREGGDAPAERKRLMLERNGRGTAPSSIPGEAASRPHDAEGAPAEMRAPRARPAPAHPRAHEFDMTPHDVTLHDVASHEQPDAAGHPAAHPASDLHSSDMHSSESPAEREPRAPAARTPPRDPDFEEVWPAPKRTRAARSFGASRGARAEEPREEDVHGGESAAARAESHLAPDVEPDLEAPAHVVSVLKSGVVDGMAYSLYSDGSIEAHLPGGPVRFASIDALRDHLDKGG